MNKDNIDQPTPTVPSPCISVCHMSIRLGMCVGCFRTIEEIAQWGEMSNEEKQAVLDKLVHRAFD